MLGRAVSELWRTGFGSFADTTLVGASPAAATKRSRFCANATSPIPEWLREPCWEKAQRGVCSCLSLMDLGRMRTAGWRIGSDWLTQQFKGTTLERGPGGFGDQGLNSRIHTNHPERFVMLEQTWMLIGCHYFFGVDDPVGVPGMEPRGGSQRWGALHFNCWENVTADPGLIRHGMQKFNLSRAAFLKKKEGEMRDKQRGRGHPRFRQNERIEAHFHSLVGDLAFDVCKSSAGAVH